MDRAPSAWLPVATRTSGNGTILGGAPFVGPGLLVGPVSLISGVGPKPCCAAKLFTWSNGNIWTTFACDRYKLNSWYDNALCHTSSRMWKRIVKAGRTLNDELQFVTDNDSSTSGATSNTLNLTPAMPTTPLTATILSTSTRTGPILPRSLRFGVKLFSLRQGHFYTYEETPGQHDFHASSPPRSTYSSL